MIPPHLFYQIYLSFLEQNDWLPLMLTHASSYYVSDVFNGGKGLGSLWPWHWIDVVLLEISIDDICAVSTGIVLKNKTSTHTPSKRDNKGVAPVVLPSDYSLHNIEAGSISHSDTTPHHSRSTAKPVMKSHCDVHFVVARSDHACQGSPK